MDPVVELDTGFVRGLVVKHEEGFDYYAFKGIPFAEPPLGELRFEDPVPKKKWPGILDCKDFGPLCFQYDIFTCEESYEEDCLHLNVYTHVINEQNKNRPVIVWIHGGELFSYGSADDTYCGPDYLIRKNIVLVTINFRLGVIGFLDLEDEVAPGNQGLKDQVMALQWVQKNIRMFGGDPDNVTVSGVTAGSAFAHYLAVSPLAKNLIHKMICHGSTMQNPWVGVSNPKSHALKFCSLLGKTLVDSNEIVNFLKTVDTKTLLKAQRRLKDNLNCMTFGPGHDRKSPNPFMPVHRYQVADQGVHIPCLVGFTSREGLLMLRTVSERNESSDAQILILDPYFFRNISRKDYFDACDLDFGKLLGFNTTDLLKRYKLNKNQVKRLYYKNEPVSDKNIDNYVNFSGDVNYVEGIHRFARVQAEMSSASTYLFRFDYNSQVPFGKVFINDRLNGSSHYDDIPFLFKMGLLKTKGRAHFEKGTQSYKIMEQMTEMWANFATYGRPTIETSELIPVHWQPIADGTNLRYMNISEDLTMQTTINIEQKFLSARQIQA